MAAREYLRERAAVHISTIRAAIDISLMDGVVFQQFLPALSRPTRMPYAQHARAAIVIAITLSSHLLGNEFLTYLTWRGGSIVSNTN
jgi:hypothetical protein